MRPGLEDQGKIVNGADGTEGLPDLLHLHARHQRRMGRIAVGSEREGDEGAS
jgi:hypothetical protein